MTATQKIPVTVITGFLGAGKTTLVRHLLAHARGKRIALIINEFGDLGVDKEILAGCGDETCREEDMIELTNGCICCTVADEFIPTMQALLERPDRPDHIVIETSGLALPQPLIRAFNWPEIKSAGHHRRRRHRRRRRGAGRRPLRQRRGRRRCAALRRRHARPRDPARRAVRGPADRRRPGHPQQGRPRRRPPQLDTVESHLRAEMRPGTGIVRARNGHVDVAALLGMGLATEDNLAGRDSHHELEHGGEAHEHDDFDCFSVTLDGVASKDHLLATIEQTIRAHDVLRLKGFAALPGAAARLAIQAVGPRVTAYFDRPWKPGEARETALVVIGESPLDRDAITASLEQAATSQRDDLMRPHRVIKRPHPEPVEGRGPHPLRH